MDSEQEANGVESCDLEGPATREKKSYSRETNRLLYSECKNKYSRAKKFAINTLRMAAKIKASLRGTRKVGSGDIN